MKEFIEKLISRLEEYKTKAYVTGITNNAYEFGACNGMDSAIKIVNQLAEEYNKDVFQEQYRNGYADGWHDCASTIQQSAPYQLKGE